jgi:hypothetical protein
MKNLIKVKLSKIMQARGYSPYFASIVLEKRYSDFFKNTSTSVRDKVWAQRRGFYSHRIKFYGLTEENHKNYVSDFDYLRLYPINGLFSHWIDDKLTIRYLLHPFKAFLPKYYYQLAGGELLCLPDCQKSHDPSIDDLFTLLQDEIFLAAKLMIGSKGEGFYKLSYIDRSYFLNDNPISKEDLSKILKGWMRTNNGGYLITEYLRPCQYLKKYWANTPNTIRVSVLRNKDQEPEISFAFIRFGTESTGTIDNASMGGIMCKIDTTEGRFFDGKIIVDDQIYDCKYHPESGQLLEGVIPNWQLIKDKIREISQYIPQVVYMGFDVIMTDDGFKIIEINSHQAIGYIQSNTPYFRDKITSKFFKGLLNNKT